MFLFLVIDGDNARITKCFPALLLLLYLCLIRYNFHCGFFLLLFRFPLSYSLRMLKMMFVLCFPWSPGPPRTVMGILLSDPLLFLASISRTFDSVQVAFSELVSTSSGSVRLQQNRLRKHALVCFLSQVCSPTTNRSRPINFIERYFGSNPLTSMASW